jgi:tetratricopeptide (TPR) repeat protein/O-antigen ligase
VTSSSSTNAFSDTTSASSLRTSQGSSRRGRSGRRRRIAGSVGLTDAGIALCVAVVVAAPLLAGGVHRGSMIGLMATAAAGLVVVLAGLAMQGRALRVGLGALVPLVFIAVPLLQSVPLPMGIRHLFDPVGTDLLRDNRVVPPLAWPLSLDPPSTRIYVGRAAAALMAFMIAYHLGSGQSRRHLMARAIGLAGVAAVAIGLGHHILGITKLYGAFTAPQRSLLAGPFVNPNHTAEFLELCAFVCLACSFQRPTALNRIGWLVGTVLCAGGAAATLSRGGVLGLSMGVLVFVFLGYFASEAGAAGRRRAALAWGGLLLGLVILGAGALGAGQLVDRFKTDAVSSDIRLQLWRQGLHVFAAHPFGIGRGAFDRVFPIYRSIRVAFPLRFAFVENEPLQLLIDCGWFFLLLITAAMVLAAWQIFRRGRRDKIEAALVAGLFAVLVHGTVDFGLETLGILLPFVAVLGIVLGRLRPPAEQSAGSNQSARAPLVLAGVASAGLIFGIASLAHSSYDDFDALLRKPSTVAAQRQLMIRAEETHPLDYLYALGDARLEPLKGPPGTPSPRLHALNRALRLCPSCETVHVEIARNLWRMGLRRQALLEWRTAVDIQPSLFGPTMGELFTAGAKPEELAAVAASSSARTLELVSFLGGLGRLADAFVVLDQADALGAPRPESLVARARLQIQSGQLPAAATTLDAARAAGLDDARVAALRAQLLLDVKGAPGADEALGILDRAAVRFPTDVPVARQRLDLVTRYEKWNAAARSLEGLKLALYQAGGSATEAHMAGARIDARLGHWTQALDEYRIVLADMPDNTTLWIEYARAAQMIGHDATARDAYAQASRLSPNSPEVLAALHDLETRQARLRALMPDQKESGGAQ